jgi:hypothetical protein
LPPAINPKAAKEEKIRRKMERNIEAAKKYPLTSFVITKAGDPRMGIFEKIFSEDFRETSKGGKKLTRDEKSEAKEHARSLIAKEGKWIFVATRATPSVITNKKGKKAVTLVDTPIGFVTFRIIMAGGGSSDTAFVVERLFVDRKYRDRKLAPRILLRALGRAYKSNPNITRMFVHDPFQFKKMGGTLEHMRKKGWIGSIEQEKDMMRVSIELNPSVLEEEVAVINAFDRYKEGPKIRKPLDRARLALARKKYNQARDIRDEREQTMRKAYQRPEYRIKAMLVDKPVRRPRH